MDNTLKGLDTIPKKVYVIGAFRDAATHITPVILGNGSGFAPLTVLDCDGERAMPAFTTSSKAMRGIRHFMSKTERKQNHVGAALVDLRCLLETLSAMPPSPGSTNIDYVGLNMGEGGLYMVLRVPVLR